MKDYLKCEICVESDHEGQFCRCEGRNIRIAKERRARGESPWLTSQPERSKREDIKWFGVKAEIKQDGLCYFEDGTVIDPSQPIDDAVL
jgi:hypothetical protein